MVSYTWRGASGSDDSSEKADEAYQWEWEVKMAGFARELTRTM